MKKINLMTVVCISAILLLTVFLLAEEQSEDINQPIENGFMFLNGEYIEAPYTLEVKDMAVYINGLQLIKIQELSQKDWRVFEDPGFPEGLHKDMGIAALDTVRNNEGVPFNFLKISYYYNNFPVDTALEKIIEYYKWLPYFKEVEVTDKFTLSIEDYFGVKRSLGIEPNDITQPPHYNVDMEVTVENIKISFEKSLKNNACIIYGNGSTTFGSGTAAQKIPKMIEILTDTSYNFDEKYNKLREIGITTTEDLRIKNFKENEQLNQRLDILIKEIINKYGADILNKEEEK